MDYKKLWKSIVSTIVHLIVGCGIYAAFCAFMNSLDVVGWVTFLSIVIFAGLVALEYQWRKLDK